jgi:ABC-2 type transport system ATP-binding protein
MKNGARPERKKTVHGPEQAVPLSVAASLHTENKRLLEIGNITKRFGDSAVLTNISFSVREKEVVGVIGPNGVGKTTLLECIAGLLHPDSGTITWQKRALPCSQRKRYFFYVPDGILPDGEQSARAILKFYADVFGVKAAQVQEVASLLSLEKVFAKPAFALSKGYRKRLLLAIALICPRPLLLFDEPFDGLNLPQTFYVMDLLRSTTQCGRTLLVSIHQIRDAERFCDRLLLLSNGCVLGFGSLDELREFSGFPGASLEELFLALNKTST